MRYIDLLEKITSDEHSEYGESDCATLAYYLAKNKGYKIGIINSDNDNFVHAFVIVDTNTGLDIHGQRPIKKILKDYGENSFDTVNSPEDLENIAFITHSKEQFVCNSLIPRLLKQLP